MDTQTISQFEIYQLRTLIQQALQLPDGTVISGWLPENQQTDFLITVDLMQSREVGSALRQFDGKTERIISSLESTVAISCYGRNGVAMATKIRTLLQCSRLLDAFKARHWGLLSCSDVRNLTATIGASFEERGQFDCVFTHNHIIHTPLEPIRSVDHLSHSK